MNNPFEERLKLLTSGDSSMWLPEKLVNVKYRDSHFKAYREIDTSAIPQELNYAMFMNRKLAENQYFDSIQVLDFIAGRCGAENNARIAISQWTSRLTSHWSDPAQLTVISYHNSLGTKIDNAIDDTTGQLKPITDGTIDTRRPEDVAFAKVRLEIDYQDLHYENEECKYSCTYFIPLPVGEITFLNTAGNPVTRVTCTIAGDPFSLTAEEFQAQVIKPYGVVGPAALDEPEHGSSVCQVDYARARRKMDREITHLGFESIFHKLCEQLAPGYKACAHATVEKIKQCFTDPNGNIQCLTVIEYYNAIIRSSGPFVDEATFPYNIAVHFATNLEETIKNEFDKMTKTHLTFTDLDRDKQLKMLDDYLALATECEKVVKSTTTLVRKAMGDTHTFFKTIMDRLDLPTPDPNQYNGNPDAFISAAEKTLRENKGKHSMDDDEIKILCWGCGGRHPWRDRHTKEIVCPNKDKPGVEDRAKAAHKKYLNAIKKQRQGWVQKKKVKFSDLTSDEKEKFRQHLVQEANSITATAPPANPATNYASGSSHNAYHYPAIVLLNQLGKPVLPAKIDNQLPFIVLTLGKLDTPEEECPSIRALVDTGAGISTGYWGFWAPILKHHPDAVQNIHTVADGKYAPIVLGGVVTGKDGDMSEHTTELTVVVDVNLRYETHHGQAVIHSIAMGNHVGVNTILGKGFIKAFGCIVDMNSGAVESKVLRCKPFAITEMFPQRYDTDGKVSVKPPNPNYAGIVKQVDLISRLFSANTVSMGKARGSLKWKLAPGPRVSNTPTTTLAPVLKPSSYPNINPISDNSSTSEISDYDPMASVASFASDSRPAATIWGKSRLVDPNYKPAFTGVMGTPVAPVVAMQENYTMSPLWGQADNLASARVKRCRFHEDDDVPDLINSNGDVVSPMGNPTSTPKRDDWTDNE
jgi:hypothetical protein